MKNVSIMLIALVFTLFSCKKQDALIDNADVKTNITVGQWKVTSYREKTEDKTDIYNGFSFVFKEDGSVTATSSNETISGSWSASDATSSYYGAPPASATFTINIGGSGKFTKINKSWDVNTSTTNTDLKLDNKEPLQDEHLEFVQ
jgi:hypothetical protein